MSARREIAPGGGHHPGRPSPAIPHGLESSIDDLLAYRRKRYNVQKLILDEVQALTEPGEIGNERADESRGNNVTSTPEKRGNSYLYTIRRLKRDRPDLADKVIAGEMEKGGPR